MTIHKECGSLYLDSTTVEDGDSFRLLIGEVTDALNFREYEVHIMSREELELDEAMSRFTRRGEENVKTKNRN